MYAKCIYGTNTILVQVFNEIIPLNELKLKIDIFLLVCSYFTIVEKKSAKKAKRKHRKLTETNAFSSGKHRKKILYLFTY